VTVSTSWAKDFLLPADSESYLKIESETILRYYALPIRRPGACRRILISRILTMIMSVSSGFL
jgi:hypothetical protein